MSQPIAIDAVAYVYQAEMYAVCEEAREILIYLLPTSEVSDDAG